MKKHYPFAMLLAVCTILVNIASAQDCQSTIKLVLFNISSGRNFAGQTVELSSSTSDSVYRQISNVNGEVTFIVPCGQRFDVSISNYASKDEIMSPPYPNSSSSRKYSYEADMIQKRKDFAMDDEQKAAVDRTIAKLPDTTFIKGSRMATPSPIEHYTTLDISLKGLDSKPLVNEEIVFSGRNRNKSFKAHTSAAGSVRLYLPKGDVYDIHFKYHKQYRIEEVEYSKGTSTVRIDIQYMGTQEYLRRKKEEEERLENERMAAANAIANGSHESRDDKVLETVMNRNKWTNKLLISDVSWEMHAYAMKLANWYKLNIKSGETTQFVLYFNGQRRNGSESGSAFHMTSPNYDSLVAMINYVHKNEGLETAKHDIKGLITGDGISKDYKDVILFVDKDAPLHDYQYFKQLNAPVHIVLCVDPRRPNPQHLTIAWKTKGSVHTLSGDFDLSKLREGDTFKLEGYTYKIMGGEFVLV